MSQNLRLLLILFSVATLAGCATHYAPDNMGDPYGFFSGLWHGLIAILAIIINIFSWVLSLVGIDVLQDIQIIGRPNTGPLYYWGFALGFLTNVSLTSA